MKKTLIFIGVLILLAALYYSGNEIDSPDTPPKPIFKTAEVAQGPLSVNISATGVVEPNFKVE